MRMKWNWLVGPLTVLAFGVTCFVPMVTWAQQPSEDEEVVEETIVVTASRTEQRLNEVPAAMTVLTSEDIESIPADDYGDLLRNVPGLNISQMSARDVQITGRAATNSLANSQLVLVDNRTLYLDFLGFVMWDLLPINPKEIKQIEVVRGPGSAVWGANAMTGVINVITKSPREMDGTTLTLGAGEFGTLFGNVTHATAGDRFGFKVSGGYYEQDPFDRPSGVIPGSVGPNNPLGTPYPPFENTGTSQPKFDMRLDYDKNIDTSWRFGLGYAGTDGIIHSGIGPFDIESGTNLSYVKADWNKRAWRFSFFSNMVDGKSTNLLAIDPATFQPVSFDFDTETYHLEASNTSVVGENHIVTYGASARENNFQLEIAPGEDARSEFGVYLQDEILIGDKVRWLIGGRFDDIDPIGSVFSPRSSLLFSPSPRHTFRLSYNSAFRAPSLIENFLFVNTLQQVTLPPIFIEVAPGVVVPLVPEVTDVFFPTLAIGNPDLKQEELVAFEVGYVGTLANGVTLSAAVYRNETTDQTDFFGSGIYTSANPPAGWPFDPLVLDILQLVGSPLPSTFSYRNIGEAIDQGVELSINHRVNTDWSWFFNYSWQDEPELTGIEQVVLSSGAVVDATNKPPEHRANLGVSWDSGKVFVNTNVNYTDDAFWTDVLDSRFYGPTEAYTLVNLGVGFRVGQDRATFTIDAQNLFDDEAQQHVFGDIIPRKVTGKVVFNF